MRARTLAGVAPFLLPSIAVLGAALRVAQAVQPGTAGGGAPSGPAGGVLDGTYPDPGLGATVAGDGLSETADVLSVNVDGVTVEVSGDVLRVKDGGIGVAKLAFDPALQSELDAAVATLQPLDADLTAIAALATNAAGRSVLVLTDPGDDRIGFWDDSVGAFAWLSVGTGLQLTGTMLEASGGSGESMSFSVAQVAHGLVVGDVVRDDGSDAYAKAQADGVANAEVVGIVSAVADADNFTLTVGGRVAGLAGLTPGTVYFLSAATPGDLTDVEPTSAGQVSKPVLVALSATTGLFFNFRGMIVSAGGAAGLTWNALALEGTFTNIGAPYGNAEYAIDATRDTVLLRGVVASNGAGTLIATLPVGARPSANRILLNWQTSGVASIEIATDGTITLFGGVGTNVSLDGLEFSL